ncbi:MAG: hypothetical protein J6A21_10225 [Lentisphaeria bacterium]|nr:hypothetical protein [Lentisphaeria bacterium]
MKKFYWIFAAFTLILNTAFSADRGELVREYEELLLTITRNYKEALKAPESRFGQDYFRALKRFVTIGLELQEEAAPWGRDFNFASLSKEVDHLFKLAENFLRYNKDGSRTHTLQDSDFKKSTTGRRNRYQNEQNEKMRLKGVDKSSKNRKSVEQYNPHPILSILTDDLNALRKCGFLEGRTGVPRERRALAECKRLVGFYSKHYYNYLFGRDYPSFRKEFQRRGALLTHSAGRVMELYGNRNGAELSCNIAQEVRVVLRTTDFNSANTSIEGRRKASLSPHNLKELQYSLARINQTLDQIGRDFVPAPDKAAARSVTYLDKEEGEDLSKLSADELREKLLALRKKILAANTLLSGVDKETLRKFRLTLGRDDLKEFEKVRKEYIQNGYEDSAASRYACTLFASRPIRGADLKELQRLYQRSVQEAMREAEKKMGR